MDGVSSAASIVAIAAAGLQISVKLVAFASQVKTASKRVNSLATDVSITSSILHQLGELIEQKPDQSEVGIFSSHGLATTKASADVCKQIFTLIEEELKCASKQARAGIKIGDPIELSRIEQAKWPFLQPSVDSLRKDLQDAKGTLMLMLQVATLGLHMSLTQNKASADRDPHQHDLVGAIKALQNDLLDMKSTTGPDASTVSLDSSGPAFSATQESRDPLADGTTRHAAFRIPSTVKRRTPSTPEPYNPIDMIEMSVLPPEHDLPNRDRGIGLELSTKVPPRMGLVPSANDSGQPVPDLPMTNRVWPLAQASYNESRRSSSNLIEFLTRKSMRLLAMLLQSPTMETYLHLFMQVLDRNLNESSVRPLFREVRICQQEIRNQLRFDQRRNRASLTQTIAMCTQEEHYAIDQTLAGLGYRASLLSIGRTIPHNLVKNKHAETISVMHLIIRTSPVKATKASISEKQIGLTNTKPLKILTIVGSFRKKLSFNMNKSNKGNHRAAKRSSSRLFDPNIQFHGRPSSCGGFERAELGGNSDYESVQYEHQERRLPNLRPRPPPAPTVILASMEPDEHGYTPVRTSVVEDRDSLRKEREPERDEGSDNRRQSVSDLGDGYNGMPLFNIPSSVSQGYSMRKVFDSGLESSLGESIWSPFDVAGPEEPTRQGPSEEITFMSSERNGPLAETKQRFDNNEAELATAEIDTLLARYTTVFDSAP